jgi:sortase A
LLGLLWKLHDVYKTDGLLFLTYAGVYAVGRFLLAFFRMEQVWFFDLNKLEQGDEVYITDANGTEYTYRVFKEYTVSPTDLSVTKAVPDKNILTLQTCTLPDYSQRLVVQAELVQEA